MRHLLSPVPSQPDHAGETGTGFDRLDTRAAAKRFPLHAIALGLALTLAGCSSAFQSQPKIEFTRLPAARMGSSEKMDAIEGRVTGARPNQRIVLYAKSGTWWVQPLRINPFTTIDNHGIWKNRTHFGTEYAALLVDADYIPPAEIDRLPPLGRDVVAIKTAPGTPSRESAVKRIHFSGYDWQVRQIESERGGTNNAYAAENVFVDGNGHLHLQVRKTAEGWTCAEIQLVRSLGYGSYSFTVADESHLEPALSFSMFTWDDAGAEYNHREMDIEVSRWGDALAKNAQYAIQPYYVPANVMRFVTPVGTVTHSFRWEPDRVVFRTVRGRDSLATVGLVAENEFTSGIPPAGGETVHMDLYVYGKSRIPLKRESEVVVEKFEYLP